MPNTFLGKERRLMRSKFISAFIVKLALCVALTLAASHTAAFGTDKNDKKIAALKSDLEYVSKKEAAQVNKYMKLQAERKEADAELNALDRKIRAAEARQAAARATAAAAREEFAHAQAKLDSAVEEENTAHRRRSEAIRNLYRGASDPDAVPSVLSVTPEKRQEAIRKNILMKNYEGKQIDVISTSKEKAQEASKEKLQHEDARIRAEAAEKVAADEEAALAPLREELAAAQTKARKAEKAVEEIVNALRGKKADYNRQIAQLVAESNALANQIKKKQSPTVPPAPGKMIKPVNAPIGSPFGMRTHPIYGDARLHAGVDFSAGHGTPIKAAKDGKVIYASTLSGYGNVIIIDHGGGVSTLYAHQSSFATSVGADVSQGKVIGYVGATGQVTGAHLHFEVRLNGTPVNPAVYW